MREKAVFSVCLLQNQTSTRSKIWRSLPGTPDNEKMLYYKLIESHLHNSSSVFADDCHALTYCDLHRIVMCFSKRIAAYGKNGTVLIVNANCIETCIVILGCIAQGIRYSIVYESMLNERKDYIIRNSDAILIMGESAAWMPQTDVPFLTFQEIWKCDEDMDNLEERSQIDPESDAYILYTSGSTELPKGVLAGYSQIIFSVDAINRVLKNTKEDVIWNCLPMAFDYGMYQLFLALDSEASFYISRQPMVAMIPRMLVDKRVTAFPVVPSLLGMILKSHLLQRTSGIKLRYITSTGDTLPVEWIKETEKMLTGTIVVPMYGITECKRVAIMPLDDVGKKYEGSCGLPLPGIEVDLDYEQGEVGTGELIVYGPNVMKGYWKASEESKKSFGYDEKRKQHYLRTGDIFRCDKDGYLYFVERKSEFIKSNGFRISGREIDIFLLNAIKDMNECCTIGIPHDNLGQQIVTVYSGSCDHRKLEQKIAELPVYLRPHRIVYLGHMLPKTSNGKFDKRQIAEIVRER